jgi:hypothetical protein
MSEKVARARHLLHQLKHEHPTGTPAEIRQAEQLVHLIERVELVESKLPKVEPPEGTIVEFRRRFVTGRQVYSYVATRRGSKWYCTGRLFKGDWMRWSEFVAKVSDLDPSLFVDFQVVRYGANDWASRPDSSTDAIWSPYYDYDGRDPRYD